MKHGPTRENNFIWLLSVLVLLQFCSALFAQLDLRGAHLLVNISLIITVIIAVWSMRQARNRWFRPKVLLSVMVIVLMAVDGLLPSQELALAQMLTMFLFLVFTIYMAWQQVMFTGDITRNTIFGAICIYILLGLLFGFAYLIAEYLFPGSMRGLDSEHWQQELAVTIYYSMVTLTTLGYGDITPVAPLTRFLAYMEAAIGVFYTTVLVASLIGLRLSSHQAKNPD